MISRVICAPLNYSHRQAGQYEAFKQVFGQKQITEFDFMGVDRGGQDAGTALIDLANKVKPDWIWLQVQGSEVITAKHVRALREAHPHCVITHWMGDARQVVPMSLAEMCRATHATFISSTGQLEMYRRAGAQRLAYVQIGLDWAEDVLGEPYWDPPFKVPAVVFCGGYYGGSFVEGSKQRLAAIRYLVKAGVDVGVVGTGWPSDVPVVGSCHVKQQHHVYRRAKVALSINHFNNIERYYSDRHLIALASGTPVVARYVPGLEEEFTNGTHCLWWTSHAELLEHVNKLLLDEYKAAEMGMNGRNLVVTGHTWERRIERLVPFIETIRKDLQA